MPLFAIHCLDKPDARELRASTRAAHLQYLERFDGSVLAGGPLLDLDGQPLGSLLIIEVSDRRAAYDFAAQDPYSLAGLFQSVAVTEWRKIIWR